MVTNVSHPPLHILFITGLKMDLLSATQPPAWRPDPQSSLDSLEVHGAGGGDACGAGPAQAGRGELQDGQLALGLLVGLQRADQARQQDVRVVAHRHLCRHARVRVYMCVRVWVQTHASGCARMLLFGLRAGDRQMDGSNPARHVHSVEATHAVRRPRML